MTLGETIKALRDEKRLSMRGLAKAVDVTPMHISNIEKGFTTGSSGLIAKIARTLETDVDKLRLIGYVALEDKAARPPEGEDVSPEGWDFCKGSRDAPRKR